MAKAAKMGEETRELILRSALRAFAEKGFEGASTRVIAGEAGVNHGLIPYYFGSKEKLWKAAVDLAFADMKSGFDALEGDSSIADDRERAGRIVRAYVHFVARHPEFVRLMHEEGKRRGPRMRWMVDRHVKPLYETVVGQLQSSGVLRIEVAPVHLFYVLAGAVGVIFHQGEECKRVSGIDPFDPEVVEEHARVVETLLFGPPNAAADTEQRRE